MGKKKILNRFKSPPLSRNVVVFSLFLTGSMTLVPLGCLFILYPKHPLVALFGVFLIATGIFFPLFIHYQMGPPFPQNEWEQKSITHTQEKPNPIESENRNG